MASPLLLYPVLEELTLIEDWNFEGLGNQRGKKMFNLWSQKRHYPSFRHFVMGALILVSGMAQGQVTPGVSIAREPASYIPDDDVIVKPVDNQLSFYQQYVASDKSHDVVTSRNQIKIWNDNQAFADQYGMDSTLAGSSFFVPSSDEKFQYFKDKYMRYLRRQGEQPIKDAPKNWYQDYRASNEVDTIDEMESRFKSTTNKSLTGKALPDSLKQKEVSLWKKTKFIFQPRLDQGLVIIGIKGPFVHARAWVGANGETEVNVRHDVDSIGLRLMYNYYVHSGRYFTSADKRITDNVYARVTSFKNPNVGKDEVSQDNTLMLLYAKQF